MKHDKISRILVISLSNLGDVILTTPVISLLRECYPKAYLSVMVGAKGVPLLMNSEGVDDVVVFHKKASWREKWKLMSKLRARHFDLVVDLRNTVIPWLIQSRYQTPLFVNRSSVAMRDQHLDRLQKLLPPLERSNKFDFFSLEEQQAALEKVRKYYPSARTGDFVSLAPGAGSDLKRWNRSGFSSVVNHFLKKGQSVTLLGDESERQIGLELEKSATGVIANLIGKLTLREAAGLIASSALVVANDSAIMHLSYELSRPTVAIFGPTNQKKYGRVSDTQKIVSLRLECQPCEQAQCHRPYRACLDDLPVAEVLSACEDLLQHAVLS